MKHIDADKLRAEIERQAKSIDNATGDFAEGRRLEQRNILAFLDTIESASDCHDLEDEIINKWRMLNRAGNEIPFDTFNGIACHFAKWSAEHLADASKMISEDLEEAAKQFVGYDMDCDELRDYETGIAAFKAGAEWQREQNTREMIMSDGSYFQKCYELGKKDMRKEMMEGAVEADVLLTLHDKTGDISLHTGYLPKELGIKYGDKVKIIIVKEEEQ